MSWADQEVWTARGRTKTGVLLLTIGVGISWIPVVKDIGGLLALIGIIYLFLGRWGFGDRHHGFVLAGGTLIVLGFLATIVVAVALAFALFQAASQVGSTSQDVANALQTGIENTVIATLAVGILSGIGQVLMVYVIADTTSRWLLIGGLAAGIGLGILLLAIELPALTSAIQAGTSGSTYDLGPVNNFQNQLQIYGLLDVIPAALTGFAYYRIWKKLDESDAPPLGAPSGL
ncbi:MAG TPA: hypothetical protein VN864_03745 [Thermoplasmata archaeon]|nr:hypothetical protein [Thermoplasmata archaeon]